MKIIVKFPTRKSKKDLLTLQLRNVGLTFEGAETRIRTAAEVSVDMANAGYAEISRVYKLSESEQIEAFNCSDELPIWFGEVTKLKQIKKIRKRTGGVRSRVIQGFTAAVKPDGDETPNAQTAGVANVTKNRMRIYPKLIQRDIWKVAATILHELGHQWFTDQKIEKVKVYGAQKAKDLAKYNPRKARRSTENYEQFFEAMHKKNGLRVKGVGYFKGAEIA